MLHVSTPLFRSFFQTGFECSYPRDENKERWDLLRDSKHDIYCRQDYQMVKTVGIKCVREGFAWSQIDQGNSVYHFDRFETMIQIAKEEDIQQVWDLNHYDYPDYLDPYSQEFVDAFAEYACAAVRLLRAYTEETMYIVPINEISFWGWMVGERGWWAPYSKGDDSLEGLRWKKQLVRATLAAIDAVRLIDTDVRFIHTDPIMYRVAASVEDSAAQTFVEHFNTVTRFETWDMITGKLYPSLGGDPSYIDLIGVNYYIDNQQIIRTTKKGGLSFKRLPLNHPTRLSLETMLTVLLKRYNRPLLISETGSYSRHRARWWKYILQEVDHCLSIGLPIHGVCVYPTLDLPRNSHFLAPNSGLWDFDPDDPTLKRIPHQPAIKEIQKFIQRHSVRE